MAKAVEGSLILRECCLSVATVVFHQTKASVCCPQARCVHRKWRSGVEGIFPVGTTDNGRIGGQPRRSIQRFVSLISSSSFLTQID